MPPLRVPPGGGKASLRQPTRRGPLSAVTRRPGWPWSGAAPARFQVRVCGFSAATGPPRCARQGCCRYWVRLLAFSEESVRDSKRETQAS